MAAIENLIEFYSVPERGDAYTEKSASDSADVWLYCTSSISTGASTTFALDYQLKEIPDSSKSITILQCGMCTIQAMYTGATYGSRVYVSIQGVGSTYYQCDTLRHVVQYDGANIIVDGVIKLTSSDAPTGSGSYLYLLRGKGSGRIYSLTLWESGVQAAYFTPYFDSSNNYYTLKSTVGTYEMRAASSNRAYFTGYIPEDGTTLITSIENESIDSIRAVESVSVLGDELSYDTMAVVAKQKLILSQEEGEGGAIEVIPSYDDTLAVMPYGTPMLHYLDNALAAKYHILEMKRTGRISFGIDAISAIGLLDRQYHHGNMFDGENFILAVSEILGDSIEYSVGANLANVAIYGWLPYDTRRNNLRQLLFATNAHVFRDSNQSIYFDYLDDSETVEVLDENVFDNGAVEYPKLATKVTLTEHNFYYLASADPVTLFDNSNGAEASGLLVKFQNAPIYPGSLEATGTLTFMNASVNACYVSGTGTLTGIPYIHSTLEIVREDEQSGREENEVTVTDATLVTTANSENVANRLAEYYFNHYIIKAGIRWNGEKCGKLYSIKNAFGEQTECFMAKMEKAFTSFVRAECELVAGVSAGESGNTFEHYAVVSSTGSWTIPDGVTVIRLTIIGAGSGGNSGLKGKNGSGNTAGAGGSAGTGGSGGRIYVCTLTGTSGSLTITIGTGGTGGGSCSDEKTANTGTEGTATTVTVDGTTYSSASGARSSAGVKNIFTEDIYALPGGTGTGGAEGGDGLEHTSESGGAVGSVSGGIPGGSVYGRSSWTSGGGGGGASATTQGSAGGSATATHVERDTENEQFDYYVHTPGAGGAGATASKRSAASVYGSGGDGGHGGGGGGGIGVFNGKITDYTDSSGSVSVHYKFGDEKSNTEVSPGTGGAGGAGGNGAGGCVLIYY